MGSAGAWQSKYRRGSSPPGNEGNSQPPDQASGNLSPVCAFHSGGKHRGILREVASFAVYVSGLLRAPGETRQDSGADARRRNGPAANGHTRGEPALSRAHFRVSSLEFAPTSQGWQIVASYPAWETKTKENAKSRSRRRRSRPLMSWPE